MLRTRTLPALLFFSIIFTSLLYSQNKVLTVNDYHRWSRVSGATISPDGDWISYVKRPNGSDDTLFVSSLSSNTFYKIPVGGSATFSSNSDWVSYSTRPGEKQRDQMTKKGDQIFETAILLNLASGKKHTVEQAENSAFSEDASYWVAYKTKARSDKSKHKGQDLIFYDLTNLTTTNIGNVSEFAFNKKSDLLAYLVDASNHAGNGVYLKNLKSGVLKALETDTLIYSGLSWDDENLLPSDWQSNGSKIAVLKGDEVDSVIHRANQLIVFRDVTKNTSKTILNPHSQNNFPDGMVISGNRTPSWSENGEMVFLGLKEQEAKLKLSRDTVANVDVFHWRDDRIQTVQERQANRDERFTYLASFNPSSSKFVQISDHDMRTTTLSRHSKYAVGRNEIPYTDDVNWGVSPADLYRVDLSSGDKTLFASQINRPLGSSPNGRYYLYQKVNGDNASLFVYDLEKNTNTNVSDAASVSFINVDHPYPHEHPAYGIAGWSKDGKSVIVNHKYDLWMLALNGSKAENITKNIGTNEQIIFRYENLDNNVEYIDTSKELLLTAFGELTKKDGFYSLKVGSNPKALLYKDASFGNVQKADNSDKVILTQQTFTDFPDYYLSSTSFKELTKVTDINPQQEEYAWGSRVLIDYENSRGIKLQGTLTLPANYEEGKKYPMVVYFYEKMSDRHNQYSMPTYDDRPHMSTYSSNGYLVFMPDNVYEVGRPGTSALDCITSATQKVIDLGYADPDNIGLQGHSWGGYQSSFILTQTDMFKTVVTGAPPTNLTSFYNNIYGNTGTNHHGIMEIGQVRMGRDVTPWSSPEVYQRENPMFFVPNIEVPFMILHGTDDGAVDWMQGLELYNAARRMDKEVILLSYPGEGHHLGREANQKDFLVRMKQFFDFHLKGTDAPSWMTDGIPYSQKLYNKAER